LFLGCIVLGKMSRPLGFVVLFLAFTSVVYAARSNICLLNVGNSTPYKPLQLQPSDCPNNASNCMAYVYNYSATAFLSKGPASILPSATTREALIYMTQDESDNIDAVVITATTYSGNIIQVNLSITGAAPGVQTLVRDDPTPDLWSWNPDTNSGNFSWDLDAKFTDGVVLGHIKFIDNYCFNVSFKPNYAGAVSKISFLSGTVANPTRVFTTPLVYSQSFEFCQYPKVTIATTDATCTTGGSATATSLTSGTAAFQWTDQDGNVVSSSNTLSNAAAGTYSLTMTISGCTAYRNVTINVGGTPITATFDVTNPTKAQPGNVVVHPAGGSPPYAITWTNSQGNVLATNVTTLSVTNAGTYFVEISDGCRSSSENVTVTKPGACPQGTMSDPDTGACIGCTAGTYSDTSDAPSCMVCPPGTWNNATNATSCNNCPANTVSGGATGPCTDCPVSTSSAPASGVCTPCPVGTDRAADASACTSCTAGSFRCDPNSLCQPCPTGTFSASGQQTCTSCDAGQYTATSGQSSCTMCPINKYAASGASVCNSCPTGTTSSTGSSVLLACM